MENSFIEKFRLKDINYYSNDEGTWDSPISFIAALLRFDYTDYQTWETLVEMLSMISETPITGRLEWEAMRGVLDIDDGVLQILLNYYSALGLIHFTDYRKVIITEEGQQLLNDLKHYKPLWEKQQKQVSSVDGE